MFLPSLPCDGFSFGKRDLSHKARGRFGRSRSSELRRARMHGGALVEPFVPPSAAPSRPLNSGLGDLVLIATCLYSAVW